MSSATSAARCNGLDPAYPGLTCYLPPKHSSECEFTDAIGEVWRTRALLAEGMVREWRVWFPLDAVGWETALGYAAVALKASSDNGDQYCAHQLETLVAIGKATDVWS